MTKKRRNSLIWGLGLRLSCLRTYGRHTVIGHGQLSITYKFIMPVCKSILCDTDKPSESPRFAAPGPFSPTNVDPLSVFNSLVGPHGTPHPERWVPGIQHPSLPPRPDLPGWRTPHGSPLPFPCECALNPFLIHSPVGRAPVTFDIGLDPLCICYSETGPNTTIPLSEPDRAQPATYPLLTHMHIKDVADDTAPQFPWPIMVVNLRGQFLSSSAPYR